MRLHMSESERVAALVTYVVHFAAKMVERGVRQDFLEPFLAEVRFLATLIAQDKEAIDLFGPKRESP